MLAIIRVILVIVALIVICIVACFYSLLRPFHRNNVHHTARYLAKISYLLGLDVEVRIPESVKDIGPVVYVANHQNIFDVFTLSHAVRPATVSVGKKSLAWVPFFGQMYWLTGNILIDRKNTNKAMNTINLTVKKIQESQLSIWLFPEGTRSKGRGLLPFKTGAFRTAAQANVAIVPICASNLHQRIQLNRWNNGKMIIEFLPAIQVIDQKRDKLRNVANTTHQLMKEKIEQISHEANAEIK